MTIEAEVMRAGVDLGNLTREPQVVRYAMERIDELEKLSLLDPKYSRARVHYFSG